ncbi:serine/threonine-protein kinase pim-1-like [Dicentrarchus labrax]|uniref:non-specific serine/threonine protein kinase n=1 Tax=Dicentrarchus labrax TaxID=13489 RepID=A0A8P4FXC1_DICLA|nr:serine/threonine-protein kinase pim-1-like [Dicentrarchus labrax]
MVAKTMKKNDSENNGSTPKPNNSPGEDCMVTRNKRKASINLESPRKRLKRACKRSEVPVEAKGPRGTKRKQKTGNTDTITGEPTKVSVGAEEEAGGPRTIRRENSLSPSTSNGSTLDSLRTSSDFDAEYRQLRKLGEGGFGSVYAGIRKRDCLPVAIKHIPKADVEHCSMIINGKKTSVPTEVLLMLRAAGAPRSAAVSLLDWFNLDQEVLLVMERPVPSVDLYNYMNGPLEEDKAKNIMIQLVEAAIKMHNVGVFHRDIKTENVLLETGSDVPRVRIIDFGCGCLVKKGPYPGFSGTSAYAPPEFFKQGRYEAGPTTVWQLGTLLYEVLDGYKQFTTAEFLHTKTAFISELLEVSKECQDLLEKCLVENPKERATLEEMQQHPWFQ